MRNDSQMRIEGRAARLRVLCQRRVRGAHAYNFGSVLAAKVNVTGMGYFWGPRGRPRRVALLEETPSIDR